MSKYKVHIVMTVLALLMMLPLIPTPAVVGGGLWVFDDQYMQAVLENDENHEVSRSIYSTPLRTFEYGQSAQMYEHQAVELILADPHYTYEPQYLQTVVIAVDRAQTQDEIDSFEELLTTNHKINFDFDRSLAQNMWGYPKTHHIVLSMANALYGCYDVEAVAQDIKELNEQGRFLVHDMSAAVIVTNDTVAAELIMSGRQLEVYLPTDTTLSIVGGVMSFSDKAGTLEDFGQNLLENGYRLLDGSANPNYYPNPQQYENAQIISDYEDYNSASTLVAKTIRRDALDTRLFGFTNAKETTSFYLFLLFVMVLYAISVIRRVTEKKIQNAILAVCILQILFISLGCFKSISTQNPTIEMILWYCYYIPILMIPAIFVYIAMYSGHAIKRSGNSGLYALYGIITALLLLLVLSNDLHGLVFTVDSYMGGKFSYNIGYIFVIGWAFLSAFGALFDMIHKSFSSPKKWAFFMPLFATLLILIYAVCYVTHVRFAREFDLTFGMSILILIACEACMQSRILPNNNGYETLFSNSSLRMEIRDMDQRLFAQAAVVRHTDENFVLRQTQISGGAFYYYDDYSTLNTARVKLASINQELEKNNEFLKRKGQVNADLAALSAEKTVYDKIDNALNLGTKRIATLLEQMKNTSAPKRAIGVINIIACSIKRECMLLINAIYNEHQSVSAFLNSLTEMKEFTQPLELRLTVSCTLSGNIGFDIAHPIYKLFCALLERAADAGCSDMVVQLYESDRCIVFSVIADRAICDAKYLEDVRQDEMLGKGSIELKPWDDTQAVLLSFEKEAAYV